MNDHSFSISPQQSTTKSNRRRLFIQLFVWLSLLLFVGCTPPNARHLRYDGPRWQGTVSASQQLFQGRLDVRGKTYVFQGLFLRTNNRFYFLAHQGPLKLFGAFWDGEHIGGHVYFTPMKKALSAHQIASDLWHAFALRCPKQRVTCQLFGEEVQETRTHQKLVQQTFTGCLGKRVISWSQYQPSPQGQRPQRLRIERAGSRLELAIIASQSQVQTSTKTFRLPPQALLARQCKKLTMQPKQTSASAQ